MALIVGTNTYITVKEADKLVENYFLEDDEVRLNYEELSDEDKNALLYRGCMDMQKLMYRGYKKDKSQKLAFPRVNRGGYESDESLVKLAQLLNSISFMQIDTNQLSSKTAEMRRAGIKNFTLGSFSVGLDGKSTIGQRSNSGSVEELLPMWLVGGVKIK